jgi:hypothetical protein
MVLANFDPINGRTSARLEFTFRGREIKEPLMSNGNLGTMPFQPAIDVIVGENSDPNEPPRNAAKAILICRPNSHPFQVNSNSEILQHDVSFKMNFFAFRNVRWS